MKKNICVLLVSMLVFCLLSGCFFEGNDDYQGGQITPVSTPASNSDGDENLSLGGMNGGIYTNRYIKLSCKLDSKWTFMTAEQLQELPDNISQSMSGSALGDAIANFDTLIDMAAENATDLTSINVVYTKLPASERMAYATMTEEEIIDSILKDKDSLIAAYKQAGITVLALEKVTVTFLGQQRTAMHMKAEVSGVAYYTLQFSYQKLGAYGVTVTLGSYLQDKTSDLMSLFSNL